MSDLDTLAHRVRPAAGEPEGALVLLHGRGADEDDLFPLLDLLDPDRRLVGATARGPLRLPPGGAHWYAVRAIGYPDPGTFHPTYATLTRWVDDLLAKHGVDPARLVIGGFSQGTVMSYAVGLGAGRPAPAGIVALSGFMPTVEGFELDLSDRSGLPVAIGHGAARSRDRRGVGARRARAARGRGRRRALRGVRSGASHRPAVPGRAAGVGGRRRGAGGRLGA